MARSSPPTRSSLSGTASMPPPTRAPRRSFSPVDPRGIRRPSRPPTSTGWPCCSPASGTSGTELKRKGSLFLIERPEGQPVDVGVEGAILGPILVVIGHFLLLVGVGVSWIHRESFLQALEGIRAVPGLEGDDPPVVPSIADEQVEVAQVPVVGESVEFSQSALVIFFQEEVLARLDILFKTLLLQDFGGGLVQLFFDIKIGGVQIQDL